MTGDRVAEIRGYVANHNALPKYQAEFLLAELDAANRALAAVDAADQHDRAENARLRAQLDTARKVADKWQRHGWLEVKHEREQGWVSAARQAARDFRAALNQGGDNV